MYFSNEFGLTREVKTLTPEQRAELRPLVSRSCRAEADGDEDEATVATDIIMSMDEQDILQVCEFQRQADREGMKRTLDTLNRALEKRRGVMLAIEDELKKQRTANLYGAGTVCPAPTATTEVGRLATILQTEEADLFGQPEVGSPGSGALDTAKERRIIHGKGRAKVKSKARKGKARKREFKWLSGWGG
jgi:hypothetical protein